MTACITHPTSRVNIEFCTFEIVIHCVIAHSTSPDCLQLQPNVLARPPYSQPSFSLWEKKIAISFLGNVSVSAFLCFIKSYLCLMSCLLILDKITEPFMAVACSV